MKKSRRHKRVALATPTGVTHLEQILKGIHNYMDRHGYWTLITGTDQHSLSIRELRGWDGDAVITGINSALDVRIARELSMPVINLSGALKDPGFPRVRIDYQAAGVLAAEFLLKQGFSRFAFYGLRNIWFSELYATGFLETASKNLGTCFRYDCTSSFHSPQPRNWDMDELEQWLLQLPKPIGLMTTNDRRARLVVDACHRLGLDVPRDVAVIGNDNDRLTCELCDPPLTSIARNGERMGEEAAALVDKLMAGRKPPRQDIIIPPNGIVKRASADILVVEEPRLRRAVDYIREHLTQGVEINEVAAAADVSRRWLEYAFRRHLRRSPREFLDQLKCEQAKTLLCNSSRPKLLSVARACGFSGYKQFTAVFQRVVGIHPKKFREQQSSKG